MQRLCRLERQREALLSDNFLIPDSQEPQLGCLPLCSEKSHLLPISSSQLGPL